MNKGEDELREIAYDILREVYNEAEPGLDFDDVLENHSEYPEHYYDYHRIPAEKHIEIFDKHIEQYNLTDGEERHIHMIAVLSLGPSWAD